MNKKNKQSNRHRFLIEMYFNNEPEGYSVKKIGDWTLVKHFDGNNGRWEVAIWNSKDYIRVQEGYQSGLFQ